MTLGVFDRKAPIKADLVGWPLTVHGQSWNEVLVFGLLPSDADYWWALTQSLAGF